MDTGDRIRSFIKEDILVGDAGADLTDETPLLSGIVDSAGLMQLVAFLEEEFDVELDEAEITEGNFRTIAAIRRLIEGKAGGSDAADGS